MKPSGKEKPVRVQSSAPLLTTPVILPSITGLLNSGVEVPSEAVGAIPISAESIQMQQQKQQEVCDRSYKQSVESEAGHISHKQCIDGLEARVAFLQSELSRKEQANKTLSQQLQNLMIKHQDDIEASKLYLEETLSKAHSQFLQKEKQQFKKHEDALNELAEQRIFKQVKEMLVQELQSTHDALLTTENKHKQQLAELEQRFIQSRQELEQEANQLQRSSLQEYKSRTSQELDVEGKLIRTQNMKMTKQQKQLEQQHTAMRVENQSQQEQLKGAVLEKDIIEARIEMLLKKQSLFTDQKDKLMTRLKQTEGNRLLQTQGHEQERKAYLNQHTKEVTQTNREQESVQGALLRKDAEVKKLRRNARILQDGRSEVEALLLDALANVKKEVKQKEELVYREALQKHQKDMQILARGGSLGRATVLPPLPPRDYVLQEELSAEDKLQVIKVVYAQLHNIRLANAPALIKTEITNPEQPGTTHTDETDVQSLKYTPNTQDHPPQQEPQAFDPFFMTAAYVEEEDSDQDVFVRN